MKKKTFKITPLLHRDWTGFKSEFCLGQYIIAWNCVIPLEFYFHSQIRKIALDTEFQRDEELCNYVLRTVFQGDTIYNPTLQHLNKCYCYSKKKDNNNKLKYEIM